MSASNSQGPLMAGLSRGTRVTGAESHLVRLALIVGLPTLLLIVWTFTSLRPAGVDMSAFAAAVWQALSHGVPATDATGQTSASAMSALLVSYAWLPRLVMAALAGAGLALAGVMFQQVLRNPLAEPLTLGVASGAYLVLAAAAIWLPALALAWRASLAFGGAALAIGIVMALTWRSRFAAVPVILAGMIVNLYFGGLTIMLSMTHERALVGVFAWGWLARAERLARHALVAAPCGCRCGGRRAVASSAHAFRAGRS